MEQKYVADNIRELKVGEQVVIPSGRNYKVGIIRAIHGDEVTVKITGKAFVMNSK